MKPIVLITAIGTMASTTIVAMLKKTKEYYLIGADIFQKNQISTSKDVDEFHVFPSAVENLEKYIEFVIEFCKQHHVDYYFATIDEEIVNLSKHRELFEEIKVKLCIANHDLIMNCHYKDIFATWVAVNMPQIAIETYDDFESIGGKDYPIFVKPIEGRASIGCKKIDGETQMQELLRDGIDRNHVIFQKYVEGEVITVDMIRNAKTGQTMQIQRRETLRNANGCGIAVEIIDDKKLGSICSELMERLNLNGVANAEFFQNEDGFKVIEINPRFSAGTGFTCLAGCNIVVNAIRIVQGLGCKFGNIAYGKHFTKRYETYQMD